MGYIIRSIRLKLCFKLHRGQVTQGGVDALVHVDIFQELPYLLVSLGIVLIIRQIRHLFFDGAHQPFRKAILPGFSDFGHTDLHRVSPQQST